VVAEGDIITSAHLPPQLLKGPKAMAPPPAGGAARETAAAPVEADKTALLKALQQTGGNQSKAAALLGISRVTLWHRLKRYGIDIQKIVKPAP